jgi:tripartite-type tricarboxylate transporter receptor subunit TctC
MAAGACALPVMSRIAWAQAYPARPITMIVPIAAGSSTDVVGRLVAERMGLGEVTEAAKPARYFFQLGRVQTRKVA